jgi:hypothetical protein
MTNLNKQKAIKVGNGRREPTQADYNDVISDETLKALQAIATSKKRKGEKLELVNGPAW